MQEYGTSEKEVLLFSSQTKAESFFDKKPENFNAVFNGDRVFSQKRWDKMIEEEEVIKIENGVYRVLK